jgi:SOS response regulatory protein OraA/RecX
MIVFITALSVYGTDEIAVSIEISNGEHTQKERLVISSAQCADLGLRYGEADKRTYEAVLYASQIHTAVKQGLSILSYGICSENALIRKLISRGNSREIAEIATEELKQNGYIDQDSDAAREAERGAIKLWGKLRITASLREKGYSDDSIRYALTYLRASGVDYVENCADLIRRRWGDIPSDPAERKKMVAAVMRYGYTTDEIRAACRRL